jgi:hypothetical protein
LVKTATAIQPGLLKAHGSDSFVVGGTRTFNCWKVVLSPKPSTEAGAEQFAAANGGLVVRYLGVELGDGRVVAGQLVGDEFGLFGLESYGNVHGCPVREGRGVKVS